MKIFIKVILAAALLPQIGLAQMIDGKPTVSFNYYWIEAVRPDGAFVHLGKLGSVDGPKYFVYGLTNGLPEKQYVGADNPVTGVQTNDLTFDTLQGSINCTALVRVTQERLDAVAKETEQVAIDNSQVQQAYIQTLQQAKKTGLAEKTFLNVQISATNGSPASQYILGDYYLKGIYPAGTNNELGFYWMQKAAANGNTDAIGYMQKVQTNDSVIHQ
ncbi:MAG: SEL1-like repeat protein [Limisphaerales bacterium]